MALKSLSVDEDIVLLARVARASRALAFDRFGSFAFCNSDRSHSLLWVENPWDTGTAICERDGVGATPTKLLGGTGVVFRSFGDTLIKEVLVELRVSRVVAILYGDQQDEDEDSDGAVWIE